MMNQLKEKGNFTREEYYNACKRENGDRTSNALDYALRKEIAAGNIIHIGRDQYVFSSARRVYIHSYSSEACVAAEKVKKDYPLVDFQIFELKQLNSFVNHLFAHNTIFISVENDAIDYVFDSLRTEYPGKIMLKPKPDEYYRYLVEDQIVVIRLPSETPTGIQEPWQSRLEKILVDITVDKLLSQIVSESEYETIFSQAFQTYLLDVGMMNRYARRRGAGEKFSRYMLEYT